MTNEWIRNDTKGTSPKRRNGLSARLKERLRERYKRQSAWSAQIVRGVLRVELTHRERRSEMAINDRPRCIKCGAYYMPNRMVDDNNEICSWQKECDCIVEPRPDAPIAEKPESAPVDDGVMQRREIIDLRFNGKWVEIWFADGQRNPDQYDECCKTDIFNKCLYDSGLAHHTILHGVIGIWVEWMADRPVGVSLRVSGTPRD